MSTKAATPAPIMRFVITGCAMSGTKYVAHLLTRSGIATGHEDVFNRWAEGGALHPDWRDDSFDGDASFIAAPHAAELAAAGLSIIHLVRPPLRVIASIAATGWLADPGAPYVAYVAAHLPELTEHAPGPERAAYYWLRWNALVEQHADTRWALPDVGFDHIMDLGEAIGVKVAKTRALAAVDRTSKRMGHKREAPTVTLDDIGTFADDVAAAADRYRVSLA
jgi:hypothetical protein